ncbi:YggT family protein [Aquibacillus sp. 3ASR75-11]|uniref:YggT family protein n=1 Tax=Terrihalobacillus insolitus TaxID=2950438 RepID=A0A9X3WRD6_9BACI|nr:YggT family protein [Terrihalobacillus insolitus]MDC3413581.1 YggT family protein [Terrihalobacillus insolitus]MDC3424662.1 YggT family protein [Terrihalobacillus insolitus]
MKGRPVIVYLINLVIGIAQFILGLRIVLKLFGANEVAPFVSWTYQTSAPLLYPFEGIFPTRSLDGGFIIEFSSLFALIVYTLIGYFLTELIMMFDGKTRS